MLKYTALALATGLLSLPTLANNDELAQLKQQLAKLQQQIQRIEEKAIKAKQPQPSVTSGVKVG
ncbi:hypothetical protein CWC05_24160, partial [Pseudoalteromonas ruthenica]